MSNILNRLKNLENERPTVLRTADMVPSRSRSNTRKRVVPILTVIIMVCAGLAYHLKDYFLPQPSVAVATAIDLSRIENEKNDRAIAAYQKSDYKTAVETLEALVKAHPERAEFHMNLAMAYQQLSKFDKAHEQLKIAIALEPNDSYAHNNLGLLALQTKQEELAEKSFAKAFELNPKSPEITLNLASYYEKTGQLKKSVETYQRYVSLPKADKIKIELLKKRIPRLSSLSAQGAREEEEEGT